MKTKAKTAAEAGANYNLLIRAIDLLSNYGIKVNPGVILSKNRDEESVYHRALICLVLREKRIKTPKIGGIINRDHSTVLYLLDYGTKERKHPGFQDEFNKFSQAYLNRSSVTKLNDQLKYHEDQAKFHHARAAEIENEIKLAMKELHEPNNSLTLTT